MSTKVSASNRRYGWVRDTPDHRDHRYAVHAPVPLPAHVDLSTHNPPAYDQGQLGSCTGNGWARAVQYNEIKEGKADHSVPSRLFIYFGERVIEGTVGDDSGAQIRDGVKALVKWGVCDESLCPYSDDPNTFKNPPSHEAYAAAAQRKISKYQRLDNTKLYDLKHCLAQGNVIVFGCSVYESFESETAARTGVIPYPGHNEQQLGGHCMTIIGYDDVAKHFIVFNSWGEGWGMQGKCFMGYDYLTNSSLADDFWTLLSI